MLNVCGCLRMSPGVRARWSGYALIRERLRIGLLGPRMPALMRYNSRIATRGGAEQNIWGCGKRQADCVLEEPSWASANRGLLRSCGASGFEVILHVLTILGDEVGCGFDMRIRLYDLL